MDWDSIVLAQACLRESKRVQRVLLNSGTLVHMWELTWLSESSRCDGSCGGAGDGGFVSTFPALWF